MHKSLLQYAVQLTYNRQIVRVGRDNVVDIATRYRLDGPGTESRWGRDFKHLSRQPWNLPGLLFKGHWISFLGWSDQGMAPPSSANINTLRRGDADLRFYITTVQDGWRKSAFLTSACFPCTIHLIMQYIESVSEWFCWRMFIETWPHSELTFRHRASSI